MSSEVLWTNNESSEMTVAIPVHKVNGIINLGLESLKNQININFGWELIIWEDGSESKKLIKTYINELPGCNKILYKYLNKNLLQIDKLIGMAKEADKNSRIFVIHYPEDYSPPKRLYIHYEHFKNKDCYISTQFLGLYCNLKDGSEIFYYGINKEKKNSQFFTQQHLNLAVMTKDILRLKRIYIVNGLEFYIRNYIGRLHGTNFYDKKHIFTDFEIDKNNWKYGFFTDGANGILDIDKEINYKNPSGIFVPFNRNMILRYSTMNDYVPNYIIQFLKKFRQVQ